MQTNYSSSLTCRQSCKAQVYTLLTIFCIFSSRHEDTDLREVVDQVEEVILASQGLQEVSRTLKGLVEFAQANHRTTVSLDDTQATAVKAAFACVLCGGMLYTILFTWYLIQKYSYQKNIFNSQSALSLKAVLTVVKH